MSEVEKVIFQAIPSNSWQFGNKIKEKAEEILQDSILIGDFYSIMEQLVRSGMVEYHQEKPKARGKFKKSSGTKTVIEGDLVLAI